MNVCVILAPYDSGRFGERMGRGPAHLLTHSVRPLLAELGHQVHIQEIAVPGVFTAEIQTAFSVCRAVADRVRECLSDGWFPLVLSGNCNTAIGTITGCGCSHTNVIWFDAHGEATTPETTTSGFLDGMGISILTGQCWRTLSNSLAQFTPVSGDRVLLVGARDLEAAEVDLLEKVGVRRVSQLEQLTSALLPAASHTDGSYLHFDLDVLDPSVAIWNQWSPPHGLTIADVADAVSTVRQHSPVKAAGIASYDPDADRDGRAAAAAASILRALF